MKNPGKAVVILVGALLAAGARVATAQQETILHAFCVTQNIEAGVGLNPGYGVIRDAHGNLYGTTYTGISLQGESLGGTVFKVFYGNTAPWAETLLYGFSYTASGEPLAPGPLVFDGAGNLYGATLGGATASAQRTPLATVWSLRSRPQRMERGRKKCCIISAPTTATGLVPRII